MDISWLILKLMLNTDTHTLLKKFISWKKKKKITNTQKHLNAILNHSKSWGKKFFIFIIYKKKKLIFQNKIHFFSLALRMDLKLNYEHLVTKCLAEVYTYWYTYILSVVAFPTQISKPLIYTWKCNIYTFYKRIFFVL
jgi:hypothetical protein